MSRFDELKQKLMAVMENPPRDFQVKGVRFIEKHAGRALIGDQMGCVGGDAVIQIQRAKGSSRITLRELYLKFNKLDGQRQGRAGRWGWNVQKFDTYCRALCGDEFHQHRIRAVLSKGIRATLLLTLQSGKSIRVTPEHEIAGPLGEWTEARRLRVGSQILTNGTAVCRGCHTPAKVAGSGAKFPGFCCKCICRTLRKKSNFKKGKFQDKDGYVRCSGHQDHPRHTSGGVYEHILVMKERLGRFVTKDEIVHHKNGVRNDNRIENLQLMTREEHARHHVDLKRLHGAHGGRMHHSTVCIIPSIDIVTSIEDGGLVDVYDIVMDGPHRNFVANGIVVHNCGKSFQTVAYLKLHPEVLPAVIVCPATLKLQWKRELWRHARLKSTVLNGHKAYSVQLRLWKKVRGKGRSTKSTRRFNSEAKRRAFISEHWHRIKVLHETYSPPPPIRDIVIVNYDSLEDWTEHLLAEHKVRTLVLDESQFIKEPSAKRSKLCKQLSRRSQYLIALSGTPIMSRPIEFFTTLQMLRPRMFRSRLRFGMSFCDPRPGWKGRGWDFSGASNLAELHQLLQGIMIRRTKRQVLKELPKLENIIIPVEIRNRREYEKARDNFIQWYTHKKGDAAAERARGAQSLVKLGELKRLIARGKLKTVVQWIKDWLDSTGEKLVVFFVHKVIRRKLMKYFPNAAVIHGGVPAKQRRAIIDKFQQDPKCRVMLGQLNAAGIGTTMTAAPAVVFVELGWVPAQHDQAAARIDRIGQKSKKIQAYYFIGEDTIEEFIMDVIARKRGVVSQVLDGTKSVPGLVIKQMILKSNKGIARARAAQGEES